MPLLMCPNCNASMNEVKRHDVAFDMCPTCRGVWLDRGELEKIIEAVQGERPSAPATAAAPVPQQQQRQPYYDRDDDDDDGRTDQRGRRRRGGFDLFDIFD